MKRAAPVAPAISKSLSLVFLVVISATCVAQPPKAPLDCGKSEKLLSGPASAIQIARQRTAQLLEKQKHPVTERLLNPIADLKVGMDRPSMEEWSIGGVPQNVKLVPTQGVRFRHYVNSRENLDKIVKDSSLLSAYVPYIQLEPGLRRRAFTDLTGVFLTKPGHTGRDVGVDDTRGRLSYVDIELDPKVPVLQLDEKIFVIPLPRRYPLWMEETYRRWKNGESVGREEEIYCKRMESEGGIHPHLPVPIKIVGAGEE